MVGTVRLKNWAMMMVVIATAVCAASPAMAGEEERLQRSSDKAVRQIGEELARTAFPNVKHVAVMPLRGDIDDYATSILKSAVTKTSYSLFTRSDEVWDNLLAEIEWGVRREDIMDPKTVQKFGQIQGVDAILYGRIWDRGVNLWSIRGHIKLSVNLADVETGQILWSSGPVEAEAYIHWSDALTKFWRYPLLIIGAVVGLIIVLLILRKITRAISHAMRPL